VAAQSLVALGTALPAVRQAVLERVGSGDKAGAVRPAAPSGRGSWAPLVARRWWSTAWGRRVDNPFVLVPLRTLVWGASIRGVTKSSWRRCLLSGGGLAVGSVLVEGSHRSRPLWGLGPRGRARPSATSHIERSTDVVASPGGWVVPTGSLPMWDWLPPGGGRPRLDRVPLPVRLWYELPYLDRYAHAWMWRHGGWDVAPSTSGRSP
jgi:hypothetical protein